MVFAEAYLLRRPEARGQSSRAFTGAATHRARDVRDCTAAISWGRMREARSASGRRWMGWDRDVKEAEEVATINEVVVRLPLPLPHGCGPDFGAAGAPGGGESGVGWEKGRGRRSGGARSKCRWRGRGRGRPRGLVS